MVEANVQPHMYTLQKPVQLLTRLVVDSIERSNFRVLFGSGHSNNTRRPGPGLDIAVQRRHSPGRLGGHLETKFSGSSLSSSELISS